MKIAVKSLGLDDLAPFNPQEKVIEYLIAGEQNDHPLVGMTLREFTEKPLQNRRPRVAVRLGLLRCAGRIARHDQPQRPQTRLG